MRNSILEQAVKLLREKRKYRYWLTAFLCLAVLVTLGTVTVLKMNGQAMSHKEKTLDCQLEIHQHTDECYDEEHNLICGQADFVVHTHNEEDCYDEEGKLVCKLPEIKAHTHGPECYQEKEELVCKLEEQEEHHHTDECYTLERGDLICGQEGIFPEGESSPTEGNTPIDENTPAAEETPAEENIPTEQIIQTEESAPTLENSPADEVLPTVEGLPEEEIVTEDGSIPEEPETGNTGGEIVEEIAGTDANAGTYEGHVHTDTCYEWKEVPTCGKEETDGHTHTDECYETKKELVCGQDEVILHTHDESCYDEEGRLTCGLLEVKEHIHGPECFKTTELTAEEVVSLNTAESEKEPEKTEDEKIVKTYKDDSINVTAEYTEFANIPDEAELVVKQITAESDPEHYAEREAAFKKEMGDENANMDVLLDIGFYTDGEEVEPDDTVTVKVKFTDKEILAKDGPVKMLHFAKDGTEILDGDNEEDGVIIFKMESFSDAALYAANLVVDTSYSKAITNLKDEYFPINVYVLSENNSTYTWEPVEPVDKGQIAKSSLEEMSYVSPGTKQSADYIAVKVGTFSDMLAKYGYDASEIVKNESKWMGHSLRDGSNNDKKIWADIPCQEDENGNKYWLFCRTSFFNEKKGFDIYYLPGNIGTYGNSWAKDDNNLQNFVPLKSYLAFNPGNTNGKKGETEADGIWEYGNIDRVRVEIPRDMISGNQITVRLPGDADLGHEFQIWEGDSGKVTIPNENAKYKHKLVGWYNIADGQYHSVPDGGKEVTINVTKSNVFYADWVAESYDFKDENESYIESEKTDDFIKTKVFDYNELFNTYSASLEQNGTSTETWNEDGFRFDDGTTGRHFSFWDSKRQGTLSSVTAKSSGTELPNNGLINQRLLNSENEADAKLLKYLFDESGQRLGVHYLGTGDHLYQLGGADAGNKAGYYYYDSDINGATYQQSEGRFYLSEGPDTPTTKARAPSDQIGFFPLNGKLTKDNVRHDSSINYFFGMSTELKFYLPANAGSPENSYNDQDMCFEFSGDDDVWVFIDGKLILDIGGEHDKATASINFATGKWSIIKDAVYNTDGSLAGKREEYTGEITDIQKGTHTLKMYYLERGGWASNCSIKFNTIPRYIYEKAKANTVSVNKIWANDEGTSIRPDSIQVQLMEGDTPVGTVVPLNDLNNWSYTWKPLDPKKEYSVQEVSDLAGYRSSTAEEVEQQYTYCSEAESAPANGAEIIIVNGDVTHALKVGSGGSLEPVEIESQYSVLDPEKVPDGIKWTIEDTDESGKCRLKQNEYYLKLGDDSLSAVPSNGSVFEKSNFIYSVNSGTGNNGLIEGSNRVIYENNTFTCGSIAGNNDEASNAARARVFMNQEITSKVKNYTITNTYLSNITIEKVDKDDTNKRLSDGMFTLTRTVGEGDQAQSYYYGSDGQWYSGEQPAFKINKSLTLATPEDGTYTLTECKPPKGYADKQLTVTFTVKDTKITDCKTEGENNETEFFHLSDNGLLLTVKNEKVQQAVKFIKVNDSNPATPLKDAVFSLYLVDDASQTNIPGTSEKGSEISGLESSNDKGIFYDGDLSAGTYYLIEETPPAGYNKLSEAIKITVKKEKNGTFTITDDSDSVDSTLNADGVYEIKVKNRSGYELPHTGSSGTQPFTIGGAILLLAGAFLLYGHSTRQRQRAKRSNR